MERDNQMSIEIIEIIARENKRTCNFDICFKSLIYLVNLFKIL